MRTILNRTVLSHSVASVLLSSDPSLVDSMSLWSGPILVLWLYLPGYLANTAAMLGGKWIPDLTGFKPRPIDGGRRLSDGHRILGDGKTWNGLIGAIIGAGLLVPGYLAYSNESMKKHAMHATAVFALIGTLGGLMGLTDVIAGNFDRPTIARLVLLIICGEYMFFSIMSFRAARIKREQEAQN